MTRPMRTWISGLVVLSLVSFAQLCAIQPGIVPAATAPDEHHSVAQAAPVAEAGHDDTACSPGECGGDPEGCPSGASICCSTWGPPTRAGSIEPPIVSSDFATDLMLAVAVLPIEHAQAARPVEIIRPPGPTEAAHLLISAVSRRGPPNFS